MQLDARTFEAGRTLDADLVIVGGGAAGITIARALAGGPLRVCLLESGGAGFESQTHALLEGVNAGVPYFPLHSCRLRFFGGTTNHWGGACWPLEPIDLEARPEIPGSGWPLSRADLDPFYRRAHEVCELGPFDYRVERWQEFGLDPPLALAGTGAVTKLIQSSPPTRFAHAYGGGLSSSQNVSVCLYANALELESDGSGARVAQVRAGALGGTEFRVRGRAFVLAAGGIENPRLLLLSRGSDPNGLGNAHDHVGRYFMEHLMVPCALLLPADPSLPIGYYRESKIRGTRVRGVLGLTSDVVRDEGLLNFTANFAPSRESPSAISERMGRLGRPVKRLVERLGGLPALRGVYLISHAEQAPNPESRVTLAAERDAFGQPRAQLAWRLTALDKRSIRRSAEIMGDALGSAGLGRVRVLVQGSDDEWARWEARSVWTGPKGAFHHMGTTRMSVDPRAGVVDADCRVHGLENLWVAGSSVFPTCGYANPTLTLVALALRLADHVAEVLS